MSTFWFSFWGVIRLSLAFVMGGFSLSLPIGIPSFPRLATPSEGGPGPVPFILNNFDASYPFVFFFFFPNKWKQLCQIYFFVFHKASIVKDMVVWVSTIVVDNFSLLLVVVL